MKKRKSLSLESLARHVGGRYTGEGALRISGVAPLDAAREGDLTFLTNPRYAKSAASTKATAILCDREIPGAAKPFLLCANPYSALARIIGMFHPPRSFPKGVQRGALVSRGAKVHRKACVLPGATVSKGARVGAGTVLYPGVFVGEGAVIGADCVLYPNSVVREDCVLGDRVILQAGAVIGADGFGFAPDGGRYLKIPQVGNVVLEDDVEIGACACVDRATLGSTRIGRGTKLDNLVQIAHNVTVGGDGVLAAQSGIAGSTSIGDHVTMGGQVGLAGHLKLGDHVTLATRTGVMEDLPGSQVYWGSPSQSMNDEMKCVAAYRDLPQMLKRLRRLEKELERLTGRKEG